jgi:uncharacterized protein YjlB
MKSLADVIQPIQNLNITRNILTEDGTFPNNGLLPLLLYHEAFPERGNLDAELVKEILETNSWTNFWIDSIL